MLDILIGRVSSINGSKAHIQAVAQDRSETPEDRPDTVGNFLSIETATSFVVGVITEVECERERRHGESEGQNVSRIDLLGEIRKNEGNRTVFQRGVTKYPRIGDKASLLGTEALRLVCNASNAATIHIGQLQQDSAIEAHVDVDEMLSKHFALFGSTGVGKSSGLAIILQDVLLAKADLRVFLVDPHNEYGHCFGGRALTISREDFHLPFWLFNFEELVGVFFRGRPGLDEEMEILSRAIPVAKHMFSRASATERRSVKVEPSGVGYTVDTPVPYHLSDLIQLINERMGKLENHAAVAFYGRLITRIETVRADPRYSFMFAHAAAAEDNMVEVLCHLFRLPPNGKPITVMQLAGFPPDAVDSVVSVLGRLAFEFGLWSDGAAPLLFVCEEAHRYAPADTTAGLSPTRKAISRIAKEGRKYGVFLGLVTQRPADLDPTIISQCSTLFAMRLANDRDQSIIRFAVSDAAASLLAFVPSLGAQEAFAFGAGVALPTRFRFRRLADELLPGNQSASGPRVTAPKVVDAAFVASVVGRWRQ